MRIELLNTGSELLLGQVTNTHLTFLGNALLSCGLRVQRQVCVPDGAVIREALSDALSQAEVVLVTGGLGPTSDDITREAAADLLGRTLHADEEVMEAIRERFRRRNLVMPDHVDRQAMVPAGATVLANANGTAPGLYFPPDPERGFEGHLFLLPGPPRELRPMFIDQVLPILQSLRPPGEIPQCLIHRVAGMGESQVESLVGAALEFIPGLELGYCARSGEVDVRTLGSASAVAEAAKIIRAQLAEHVYAEGAIDMAEAVLARLKLRGETVATAESCTGGAVANRLTNISGASAVFLAGYVTYANAAKVEMLGVDPALLATHGAVSEPIARAMAEGALLRSAATHALATTGIAGPDGGSEEKPVGTVFLALASRQHETVVERHRFSSTDRETFKTMAVQYALDLLRRRISPRS